MPGEAKDPTTIFPGKEERPARILLFRHGAAEGSGDGRFISRTDNHLSAEGEGAGPRGGGARAKVAGGRGKCHGARERASSGA